MKYSWFTSQLVLSKRFYLYIIHYTINIWDLQQDCRKFNKIFHFSTKDLFGSNITLYSQPQWFSVFVKDEFLWDARLRVPAAQACCPHRTVGNKKHQKNKCRHFVQWSVGFLLRMVSDGYPTPRAAAPTTRFHCEDKQCKARLIGYPSTGKQLNRALQLKQYTNSLSLKRFSHYYGV